MKVPASLVGKLEPVDDIESKVVVARENLITALIVVNVSEFVVGIEALAKRGGLAVRCGVPNAESGSPGKRRQKIDHQLLEDTAIAVVNVLAESQETQEPIQ